MTALSTTRKVKEDRTPLTYIVVFFALSGSYLMLRDSTWQGSVQLHTIMEVVATLLALIIGIMALVRFYSQKNNTILFIGAGFLGAGFLDGYHAVVTSSFFSGLLPSELSSLIPWSWIASRLFLSVFLWLSWLAWQREKKLGEQGKISEVTIYQGAGGLTLASFIFFAFVSLPRAYYPEFIFHRPEEFVPAFFFLLALIGYWRKGHWKQNDVEHWLIISLIVGFMGQVLFMSFSGQVFDTMFDIAHLLKKVSYVCVLTGLLISMYTMFREADESKKELSRSNETLQATVMEYTAFADQISVGDLSGQLTLEEKKDDPLVKLGHNINAMAGNLHTLIRQVQQNAAQVSSASQQMSASAEQTDLAGKQVTTSIQQVAQGAAQQTLTILEVTNNAEQMARAAEDIARGAQEQTQEVQKMSNLIDEMSYVVSRVGQVTDSVTEANAKVTQAAYHGVTVVEQTNRGMEVIRTRTNAATEKIKEMNIHSKEIGRIVETIDDIADKTDMLALNAAVEAARAGEHGRGFAVVADQVRKLSENSKVATRDISELVERVQETISETITAIESTTVEVDNGSHLTEDTTQSLKDILQVAKEAADLTAERIGGVVTQLKQISEGVVTTVESVSTVVEENTVVAEEMAANSQTMTEAMEGVASVAQENSALAEEVSASAEEMSAQVEEVVDSAEKLSTLADNLHTATVQFQWAEPK